MSQKKVSVIIPFYRNVEWLTEAVESVLAQTYTNIELIVVNDGSPDDVDGFLKKYGDRIVYICQDNQGPGAARNNGIKRATGYYVAFQDSDDIWLPTKLEKQIALLEESGASWCHCGCYFWYPSTDRLVLLDNSHDYGDVRLQRFVSTRIEMPCVVVMKSLLDSDSALRFTEGTTIGEDDQLYTKIAQKNPIAFVEEPLAKVRVREGSSFQKVIERFHLRKDNYNLWMSRGWNVPVMVSIIHAIYRFYAALLPLRLKNNGVMVFVAKCLWTLPFAMERVYLRYLYATVSKDEKYRLKLKTTNH